MARRFKRDEAANYTHPSQTGTLGGIVALSPMFQPSCHQRGASSLVGNPEVVQGVMNQGPQLQVFAELQPDTSTFSGYRWSSSRGPHLQI